jgi:CubicO group peptidase (beta-lactamase class C family)
MTSSAADAVADACRYFDRWLAFRQRYERVPGVQAAVLSGDEVLLSTAHGMADVESGVALTPSHLFRIASHSKTFTATAIMQLAERDVVRLDDRVGAWLAFLEGSPLERVTLRELLSHASGIVRDGWDGDFWQLGHAFPDVERLQQISLDAADVLPRNERFKYSNIAYSLLGMVIAQASGQTYAQYVNEHIVRRLQLADTGPELDPARADQYATGYSALSYADRRLPIDHVDTGAMASATGFYSTAADVVRYASAHFLGDDRLLTDDSKRQMQRTQWEVEGTAGTEYGLGLAISTIGKRRVLGHGGGYPGHITRTYFDPVDKLAVSVLTNAIDGPALTLATAGVRLIDLALDGDGATDAVTSIDVCAFEGRFASLWGSFDIVALGGRLFQIDPTQPDPIVASTRLDVIDQNTLRIAKTLGYGSHGELVTYERNEAGDITSIRGGSGLTSFPRDQLTAAVATRDRIALGQPLAPR